MLRALTRALIALAVACLVAPATSLGAGLRAADPPPGAVLDAPPSTVRVATAAELSDAFLLVEVISPRGIRVSGPTRITRLDPTALAARVEASARGGYAVRWRALGRDGSVLGGTFTFRVGSGGPPPPLVEDPVRPRVWFAALARMLLIGGPVVLLGLAVLRGWVLAPAARSGGVRPPGTHRPDGPAAAVEALVGAGPAWWRAWQAGAVAWFLGIVLTPVAILWQLRSSDVVDLLTTRPGAALLLQLAALVVTIAVALASPPRAAVQAGWAAALAAAPALALLVVSATGHAGEESDRVVAVGADTLHAWATAAWIGGLVGLATVLPVVLAGVGEASRIPVAAAVVVRFSAVAIAAVAVLVVTGVYRALAELDSPSDLLDTAYGVALLVKLVLFALLLVSGAYNRLVLHPRLERAALGLRSGDGGARVALRRSVLAELALAAGVMAMVGVMVSVVPPA